MDLVERLRKPMVKGFHHLDDDLRTEAAAEIADLRSANALLHKLVENRDAEITLLRAENARLQTEQVAKASATALNKIDRLCAVLTELAEAAEIDMKHNQGYDEPDMSGWWSTRTELAIKAAREALK